MTEEASTPKPRAPKKEGAKTWYLRSGTEERLEEFDEVRVAKDSDLRRALADKLKYVGKQTT